MKANRSLIAIALALSVITLPSAIGAEKTSNKAAGPSPTTVVNTILSGTGVPSKTRGLNGDFYIDTKNLNLYGPKIKGVWKITTSLRATEVPVISNIIGESGATGQTGATGEKGDKGDKGATGDKGANGDKGATGLTGLQGIQGLTGSTGSTGATGALGAPGATGLAGAIGLTGVIGATGSAGTAGTAGAKGETGTQGAKGDNGAQGIQGVKGETGTAGAAGTSESSISYLVNLANWMIATNQKPGTSDSGTLVTLEAGSYTFNIAVDGTFAPETAVAMYIGMQVIASAGSLDYQVFSSDAITFINDLDQRHYQFMIIGRIVCTSSTTLKLRATDKRGLTSGNMLSFTGKALINKVGSIG
jgi:hypothetical protein